MRLAISHASASSTSYQATRTSASTTSDEDVRFYEFELLFRTYLLSGGAAKMAAVRPDFVEAHVLVACDFIHNRNHYLNHNRNLIHNLIRFIGGRLG